MENNSTVKVNKKDTFIKQLIRVVLPLSLGTFILYLLYKETNFTQMWATIKNANYAILAFSLIFGLLGNTFRAYRWNILIKTLGYTPKISNLIFAVWGNYAVNFALPRAGEVWRCGVIAEEDKVPFVKLFGTMILDRLLDTITVALIALLAFGLNMDFFLSYIKQNEALLDKITNFLTSPWLYAGIIAFILVIVLTLKIFRNTSFLIKTKEFFKSIGRDMKVIWHMKQKRLLLVYTFAIWFSYFLFFYITFFAFDFTYNLGFTAGLIAFAMSSISMGIPTNGGIGAWHVATTASLVLYGVATSSAEAFAFAVFAIQSLWTILCGLFGIGALAIKNRNK